MHQFLYINCVNTFHSHSMRIRSKFVSLCFISPIHTFNRVYSYIYFRIISEEEGKTMLHIALLPDYILKLSEFLRLV